MPSTKDERAEKKAMFAEDMIKEMKKQVRMQKKLSKIAEEQQKIKEREEKREEKMKKNACEVLTRMLKKRIREEKKVIKIQKRALKLQKREEKKKTEIIIRMKRITWRLHKKLAVHNFFAHHEKKTPPSFLINSIEQHSHKEQEKSMLKAKMEQLFYRKQAAKERNIRKGSLVIGMDETCIQSYQRVSKVLVIVEREVVDPSLENKVYESMAVIKLHYNGQIYVIPLVNLRKATDEEKRNDPRDDNYWTTVEKQINLNKISWVDSATSCYVY